MTKFTEQKTETYLNILSHFKFSKSSSFIKWVYAPSLCKATQLCYTYYIYAGLHKNKVHRQKEKNTYDRKSDIW